MSSPLAHATWTERYKVLGFRRPNNLGPKFVGVNVHVGALERTVRLKKRGLALTTPNEKSNDGTTRKRSWEKRAEVSVVRV
jgi:hypothetical protein